MLKQKGFWIAIGIIGILAFLAIPKCSEVTETRYNKPLSIPKAKEINKPFVKPEIFENIAPKVEKKYKKKDTVLRKEAEKKDIILDVKIEDGKLVEDIISDSGEVREVIVPVPIKVEGEVKEVLIDQDGKVEAKERTKAGKVLYRVGKVVKKGGKIVIVSLAAVGVVTIILLSGGN